MRVHAERPQLRHEADRCYDARGFVARPAVLCSAIALTASLSAHPFASGADHVHVSGTYASMGLRGGGGGDGVSSMTSKVSISEMSVKGTRDCRAFVLRIAILRPWRRWMRRDE